MLAPWQANGELDPEEKTTVGYGKLLADEMEGKNLQMLLRISHRAQRTSVFTRLLVDLVIIISILSIAFTLWFVSQKRTANDILDWVPCGNSSAEALAAGCHYEPMQRSWIPNACYFEEPSNEYHPFEDREWFYDPQLTRKLGEDDMCKLRNGDEITVYSHFFHNEHCIYYWRKLAIAVAKRLPLIDSKTANVHHATHCAQSVTKEIHDVGIGDVEKYRHQPTLSSTMFQTCVPLNWR